MIEPDSASSNASDPVPEVAATPKRSGAALRVIALAVVLVVLFVVARQAGGAIPEFAEWVDGLGAWGPLVFILGYAAAAVGFVPGSLLTLAGGAVFGLGWGTLWVFLGASAGAVLAFLVARYIARDAIQSRVEGNDRFAAIDRAIGKNGLKITFLLRLSPVFPFNLLNYALGLTRVSLRDYSLALFGMLPATMLYVYYGKLAGDVAALAAGAAPEKGTGYYVVLGLGLIATLAVTTVVTRIATRSLREATDE